MGIEKLPNSINSSADEKLDLCCVISGFPKPEISWLFNNGICDIPFDFNEETGIVKLTIEAMSTAFGGTYACKITNVAGEAKCACKVVVKASSKVEAGQPPEFILVPDKTISFVNGSVANISCTVKGHPFPDIKWSVNDKEMKKAKVSTDKVTGICTFSIPKFKEAHQGKLSCTAKNKHGEAQCETSLVVGNPTPPDSLSKPVTVFDKEVKTSQINAVEDKEKLSQIEYRKSPSKEPSLVPSEVITSTKSEMEASAPSDEVQPKNEKPKIVRTLMRHVDVKEFESATFVCKFRGMNLSVA